MKPVNQTIFDSDGGNCLTAVIASILELDIDDVPNFARDHGDDCAKAAREWLSQRGLRVIEIGFAEFATFANTFFDSPGEYCILSGPSSFEGRGHAVVGQINHDGVIEVVHDPIGRHGPCRDFAAFNSSCRSRSKQPRE